MPPERNANTTALYGFVAWIAVHICFTIFLLWAYTPDRVLVSLGVTYYPSKHWALALPCWTLVSLLTAVVLYAFYNVMRQPDLESLANVVDEYTRVPDERNLSVWADEEQLPPNVDLPITLVSRLLHLQPAEPQPAMRGRLRGDTGADAGRGREAGELQYFRSM